MLPILNKRDGLPGPSEARKARRADWMSCHLTEHEVLIERSTTNALAEGTSSKSTDAPVRFTASVAARSDARAADRDVPATSRSSLVAAPSTRSTTANAFTRSASTADLAAFIWPTCRPAGPRSRDACVDSTPRGTSASFSLTRTDRGPMPTRSSPCRDHSAVPIARGCAVSPSTQDLAGPGPAHTLTCPNVPNARAGISLDSLSRMAALWPAPAHRSCRGRQPGGRTVGPRLSDGTR